METRRHVISYFGVNVALEWDEPELDEPMAALLLPIWQKVPNTGFEAVFRLEKILGRFRVVAPDLGFRPLPKPNPVETLERRLHLFLAMNAKDAAFIHAGVVRFSGKTVLLPGKSFSGKTSLVYALTRYGAQFVSDEYAVIDRNGFVHPFPRPISIRDGNDLKRIEAKCLGWAGDLSPTPLSHVIQTQFQSGSHWDPVRSSPGGASLALFAHAVAARTRPELILECVSVAVKDATFLVGPRGEAEDTAIAIIEQVSNL